MKKLKIIAPVMLALLVGISAFLIGRYDLVSNPTGSVDISEEMLRFEKDTKGEEASNVIYSKYDSFFGTGEYDTDKNDSTGVVGDRYVYITPKVKQEITENNIKYQILTDGSARFCGTTDTFTELTVPNKVSGHSVRYIAGEIFDKDSLEAVILPNTAIIIENNAFESCVKLQSITCSNKLLLVGDRAFYGCRSLRAVSLPDLTVLVGNEAFCGTSILIDFVCPENLTVLGDSAFSDCTALKNVEINENLSYIGQYAFKNCKNIEKINLPSTVYSYENTASFSCFQGCSSLKSITVPQGIAEISDSAFLGCSELETVSLPSTMKAIGHNSFVGCRSLKEVNFDGRDCDIQFDAFLFSLGLKITAQSGGTIENYCGKKLFIAFEDIS